ncbi:hypothetical protein [Persephonella sp. KM09-Lau-8]|uniref:hypothetical protein n=1 Tax=Persephonella sp. KM09-Lau-8 TaxID=1158345 RepID=UPI000495E826|nr:hypothetical protein [Persephonella sp. KM09-Lau-8]
MSENNHIYDFDVFKALVELEIRRIVRYGKESKFSIAFLYAPDLATKFRKNRKELKEIDIAFILRDNIRAVDVISPVEEDFVFLFFPETGKKEVEQIIERIKKVIDENIIHGIASYPEDGKDKEELFTHLVEIMNKKLIPVIELK